MKRIIVSVTNDLVTDNRVSRVCDTLQSMGFKILLLGRERKNSPPLKPRGYKTKRMKLVFEKGSLFYAEYNIRLFLILLFTKSDLLLSNDLDTLLASFLVSRLKRKPLIYDSHEFYTEVPELIDRNRTRKIWLAIEKSIIPKLKYAYTVSEPIANAYETKYGIDFSVVRNLPKRQKNDPQASSLKNSLSEKIIIYQGSLNEGRGLESAIRAMHFVDNVRFIIAGDGDISFQLKKLVLTEKLQEKVTFTGRLSPDELLVLTQNAHLGLSIEEDLGLNYRFALPNKLFDYIQANIPVLVSDLPEMVKIVNTWRIGLITPSHDPKILSEKIKEALFDEVKTKIWKKNLVIAAQNLNWENEENKLKQIFSPFVA